MHVRSPDPVASPPRAVIRLLGGAATSHDAGRAARSPSAITRWAAAVALGGVGHYARAAGVLEALRRDPAVDPGLRAHALVTRASHLRQLGGHAAATPLDGRAARLARGLGCPVGPDDPWGTGAVAAVADALTGLAADALGPVRRRPCRRPAGPGGPVVWRGRVPHPGPARLGERRDRAGRR